jgi:hypothetical protein
MPRAELRSDTGLSVNGRPMYSQPHGLDRRLILLLGSFTPRGGLSVQGNMGGTDQSSALLKSTTPSSNMAGLTEMSPPPTQLGIVAPSKLTWCRRSWRDSGGGGRYSLGYSACDCGARDRLLLVKKVTFSS